MKEDLGVVMDSSLSSTRLCWQEIKRSNRMLCDVDRTVEYKSKVAMIRLYSALGLNKLVLKV